MLMLGAVIAVWKGSTPVLLDKMVYLQHCTFLPSVDKLRSDRKNFSNKKVLKLPTPKMMKYVDTANGRLSGALSWLEEKKILQETGCKGSYALPTVTIS